MEPQPLSQQPTILDHIKLKTDILPVFNAVSCRDQQPFSMFVGLTIPKPPGWQSLPLYKKILHYREQLDERFAPFVDKLIAKQIVKEICGDEIQIARVIRELSGPEDIRQEDLNPAHIIKATHGCGWNVNISEKTDLAKVREKLIGWNRHYNPDIERQYAFIQPRFFIEEKIVDPMAPAGQALVYMFRCIHGVPITLGIKSFNGLQNSYDLEWNLLAVPAVPFKVSRPPQLPQMISLAKTLSRPFEFVRVDFHLDAAGQIFFSEFTFTPAGGTQIFSNHLESMLGSMWT